MHDNLNKQNHGQGKVPGFPRLLAGQLSLDFVNSIDGRIGPHPQDFLTDALSVVQWGYHVSLLSEAERDQLLLHLEHHPGEAASFFTQAIALREALYRIVTTFVQQESPAPEDLDLLQREYTAGLSHAQLNAQGSGVGWHWPLTPDPRGLVWAIARSALELLTSPELTRVRQCPGCDDCGWLFLDTSKGGKRQWCSMEGCGSRVKMRRLYQRQQQKLPSTATTPQKSERKSP